MHFVKNTRQTIREQSSTNEEARYFTKKFLSLTDVFVSATQLPGFCINISKVEY